ncbi:hypothetical protein SUGI_0114500 [Cryptomeria japonica]|nr:hypothetical protein SUGI_0114500 [Cryptomeria japonica]
MVAFTADERLVGDAAKFQISSNPLNTVFDVKRLIGRQFADLSMQADMKLWPFRVVSQENGKPMVEVSYKAITYGFGRAKEEKKHILVFDLGGGTFDVSIFVVQKGKFEVKSVGGEAHLGGEDFDNRMVTYCAEKFKKMYKTDLCASAKALRRLRSECERAKRSLSSAVETVIDIDCLYEGHDFFLKIRRAKFEELKIDLFEKCMKVVKKSVEDAKLSKSQIDDIVLVGGSSRIPKVQELVRDFFDGKELCRGVNPDEAVAYGAALQAAVLNKEEVDIVMVDVTPLSLGIEVDDGVMMVVVPRNSPLPIRKETSVTTLEDDQTSVDFEVYEGERTLVVDNNLLGKFVLTGIPSALATVPKIKVCFEVDAEGILNVSAHDKGSGATDEITITNEGGRLSIQEIDKMRADAEKFRKEDEEAMEKHVAKNDLECYVSNMKKRAIKAKSEGSVDADVAELDLISTIAAADEWLEDNEDTVTVVELQDELKELKLKCTRLFSSKRFKFTEAKE